MTVWPSLESLAKAAKFACLNVHRQHQNSNSYLPLLRALLCVFGVLLLAACDPYARPNVQARQIGWEPDRDLTPYLNSDSMLQSLTDIKDAKRKLDSLFEWTDMLKDYDENAALLYANQAYQLAVEKGFRFAQSLGMYFRAFLKGGGQILGEGIEDALADARISKRLLTAADDELWHAKITGLLGYLYYLNWRVDVAYVDTAEYYSLAALNMLEYSQIAEPELSYLKGQNYLELANILSADSAKAVDLFHQSIQQLERADNPILLGAAWVDLGAFYNRKRALESAKAAFLKGEALLNSVNYRNRAGGTKNLLYAYQRLADLLNTQYSRTGEESYFEESMAYVDKCKSFSRDLYYTYMIAGYNYQEKAYFLGGYAAEADSAIVYYKRAIEKAGEDGVYQVMNRLVRNISTLCAKRDRLLQENCSVLFDDSGYYMQFINDYYSNLMDTVRNELQASNQRIRTFESEQQSAMNKRRVRRNWLISGLGLLFAGMLFLLALQKQQKRRLQARMEALRAQINPHFMSNSLNAIEYLVNMNQREAASKYLVQFSRLSRRLLNSSRSTTTTLKEELQTLKYFLSLEELRFRDKLSYDIEVAADVEAERLEIPALLLQPYVENAILHGIKPKDGPGNLLLKVEKQNKHLVCIIEDDGIGREKARALKNKSVLHQRESHGMKITEERLKVVGKVKGSKVEFVDLHDEHGMACGTRVVVQLPLKFISN